MESLPQDVFQHILSFLERKDLVRLVLVSRRHLCQVREALYAELRINLFSSHTALLHLLGKHLDSHLLQPLEISHPARLVRHFTVTGAALASPINQSLLCQALAQMNGLLSLDIAIKTFPDSVAREVLHKELCGSPTFLPNLLALKTDDAQVAISLIPGRPVYSVSVQDSVPEALSGQFLNSIAGSTNAVSQLQLRLEVADNDAAVAVFSAIAADFKEVSVLCIEFSILSPSEKPLNWMSVKDILSRMGPAMSSLYLLHTMSISIYPEPHRMEEEVKEVIELCRMHAAGLRCAEFTWHMWTPLNGLRSTQSRGQTLRGQWAFRKRARG